MYFNDVLCRAALQVDYANNLIRYPKMSAWWLSQHFFKPGAAAQDMRVVDKAGVVEKDEI
jgi:hypothetical protein